MTVSNKLAVVAIALMALATALAVAMLTWGLSSTNADAGVTHPLEPGIALVHSPATVTSCTLDESGHVVMTGKLHATRPYASSYVVHGQVLQNGVRVQDAYARVKNVPPGKVVPYIASGTTPMSGDGIECQILDVT